MGVYGISGYRASLVCCHHMLQLEFQLRLKKKKNNWGRSHLPLHGRRRNILSTLLLVPVLLLLALLTPLSLRSTFYTLSAPSPLHFFTLQCEQSARTSSVRNKTGFRERTLCTHLCGPADSGCRVSDLCEQSPSISSLRNTTVFSRTHPLHRMLSFRRFGLSCILTERVTGTPPLSPQDASTP